MTKKSRKIEEMLEEEEKEERKITADERPSRGEKQRIKS